MKRAVGCALGAAILLCSCTGDDETAGSDDSATPTPEFSGALTAWFLESGSAPARAALEAAVAAFEAEHPAVTISVEYVPSTEARKRLASAIAAGEAPNLAETSTVWTAELVAQGGLVSLPPADGVEYVESLLEPGVIDGTSYGLPWYGQTQALIYRTDVFSRAGVSAPTTWDDVFTVGDTITAEAPDIAPMHVGGDHLDLQAPLLWAAGGDIATQQGGVWRPGVDSDAGRAAFSHFESVWKKGWSPRAAIAWTPDDVRTAFAGGKAAMMIGGLADVRAVVVANPALVGKIGTALLPAGPGENRDAVASGNHLVVLDGSMHQEAAAAVARFLTTPEQAVPIADAVGALPGTREGIEAAVGDDQAMTAFGAQLIDHSRTYPAASWWQKVTATGAFEASTQQLMQGRITAHEAAAAVDAAVRRAIG